jgi:solute carrier family 25, member 39/40
MTEHTRCVLITASVNPLDVVRIRLQSQATPTPAAHNLSKYTAYSSNFKALPADLGVTACCREVFWVGDSGHFCLAGNGHGPPPAGAVPADCAIEEVEKKTFRSTFDAMKKISRNEGPLTLWRGLTPTLLMAIPANVIYFTGYDWLRFNHASPIRKVANDTYAPLIAGSFARVLAGIAVSPLEMFRTRMQATPGGTTGVFKETLLGLHRMTQTQGYTSLWRGLTLTMWRDVPFSALYWWGYEASKNALKNSRHGHVVPANRSLTSAQQPNYDETDMDVFIDSFSAGGIAGGAAAFVTTPFDVGKTRQQTYRHAGDDSPSVQAAKEAAKKGKVVPEEMSMPRFMLHIWKEEGFHGTFKGWIPRVLKVAPACAIMISSYELGKRWATSSNARKDNKADL